MVLLFYGQGYYLSTHYLSLEEIDFTHYEEEKRTFAEHGEQSVRLHNNEL